MLRNGHYIWRKPAHRKPGYTGTPSEVVTAQATDQDATAEGIRLALRWADTNMAALPSQSFVEL